MEQQILIRIVFFWKKFIRKFFYEKKSDDFLLFFIGKLMVAVVKTRWLLIRIGKSRPPMGYDFVLLTNFLIPTPESTLRRQVLQADCRCLHSTRKWTTTKDKKTYHYFPLIIHKRESSWRKWDWEEEKLQKEKQKSAVIFQPAQNGKQQRTHVHARNRNSWLARIQPIPVERISVK